MKTTDRMAAVVGLDVHRRFSTVTARNAEGKIAWRQRLDHRDRGRLRKCLDDWPGGMPVILESSFGWEWMCEELERAGLEPRLASRVRRADHEVCGAAVRVAVWFGPHGGPSPPAPRRGAYRSTIRYHAAS